MCTPSRHPIPIPQAPERSPRKRPLAGYALFIVKNVVGWILILLSFALGPMPGPGGIVVFLVGFGMIWFPGKRRLVARIFRGIPFNLNALFLQFVTVILAAVAPLGVMGWFVWRDKGRWHGIPLGALLWLGVYTALCALAWLLFQALLIAGNYAVTFTPRMRRAVRPWLRRRGIDLLPARRRQRGRHPDGTPARNPSETEEIVRIHPRHRTRLSNVWKTSAPWLRRLIGLAITIAIFAWMLRPVYQKWDQVGERVRAINWGLFALASLMFAIFLFVFRVLSWRTILAGFGHRLPLPAATRIWSTSELARYLPGVIWQVVGRVYLVKPYGVSGTVCSTSQILELVVFLLANVAVALGCLAWFGYRMPGHAKTYLLAIAAIAPFLMLLLHPKVFYTTLRRYMKWRGKELPTQRVRGKTLTFLAIWAILGLLWQSGALWILTHGPLHLEPAKWWVVAGAYCLAWCAGFLAFWAPGGLGVREFVFVTAMMFALPPRVEQQFHDPTVLYGFLAFIGIMLRLWTIAGELILTATAYAIDYRGALGRPDAPGRVVAISEPS
jgi:uncharacterized membrane protein YbhN (UPF0104 family)